MFAVLQSSCKSLKNIQYGRGKGILLQYVRLHLLAALRVPLSDIVINFVTNIPLSFVCTDIDRLLTTRRPLRILFSPKNTNKVINISESRYP